MLLLVLADNLLVLFVGWEGVGLCSYLLIGFWYDKDENAAAGKKAFIVNRIGDVGFVLGLLPAGLERSAARRRAEPRLRAHRARTPRSARRRRPRPSIALLLLRRRHRQVGAAPALRLAARRDGRPDAGLGADPRGDDGDGRHLHDRAPARGLRRCAPAALEVVAVARRRDRALRGDDRARRRPTSRRCSRTRPSASSASCSWRSASARSRPPIFHLVTHAFFKALLFLGAGSVIHGMGGEQDIRKMGGLRTQDAGHVRGRFSIGTLAIAGAPGARGLLQQGRDPLATRGRTRAPRALGWSARSRRRSPPSTCSACSSSRSSASRAPTHEVAHHVHESPPVMTVPLVVLAVLSVVGGWVGLPEGWLWGQRSVGSSRRSPGTRTSRRTAPPAKAALMLVATLLAARRRRRSPTSSTCASPACRSILAWRLGRVYALLARQVLGRRALRRARSSRPLVRRSHVLLAGRRPGASSTAS